MNLLTILQLTSVVFISQRAWHSTPSQRKVISPLTLDRSCLQIVLSFSAGDLVLVLAAVRGLRKPENTRLDLFSSFSGIFIRLSCLVNYFPPDLMG